MRATLASIVTSSALSACGAGLGGAPAASIAPDTVSLPAPGNTTPDGARTQDPLVCDRAIDDFRSAPAGELPPGWETWRDEDLTFARRDRAFTVIREQDHSLLRVAGTSREITIGRSVDGWDFERYPVLEWRWRMRGSTSSGESAPETPLARVGAVWLTGFPFVARRIEYTWSLRQPIAAQGSSRFGQDRSIVVASSESADGHWHTVRVDVRRHYEAIFSKDPGAPAGIAVTASERKQPGQPSVDYREFKLCRLASAVAEAP
jgi:hypothetical protein